MSIEVVKRMYAAMEEGDLPTILSLVSNDCQWDHRGPPGPPFNQLYVGTAGVEEFFKTLAETLDTYQMEFHEFFGEGDRVIALGVARHRVLSTGKECGGEFVMSHTVRDGLVTSWRPVFDMTMEAEAFKP